LQLEIQYPVVDYYIALMGNL